ncbi:MAG: hypothetical protein ACN0LA_04685 [Candidatus Longimicrobiales bacterium M2_2A_002]
MSLLRPRLFLVITVLLAAGCSDSGTGLDGISIDDFTGTWRASSHSFTNNSDASETFDLIAHGGETRVTVLSGGRARMWVTDDAFYDEWDAQLSVSGNVLTATPAESVIRPVRRFVFALSGDDLSLEDADSEFDFTSSAGTPVSATEAVVLVRQ